mmetsp:Transcript_36556/g.37955  ORF Transcript_36556/g.37955 Transcript_36556/m.37955 type:complete len:117 (+) Transcript_36556:32-382(+)
MKLTIKILFVCVAIISFFQAQMLNRGSDEEEDKKDPSTTVSHYKKEGEGYRIVFMDGSLGGLLSEDMIIQFGEEHLVKKEKSKKAKPAKKSKRGRSFKHKSKNKKKGKKEDKSRKE